MDFDSWIQGSSKKHDGELLILWNKNNAWGLTTFEDSERSIRCANRARYHNIAFCSSFFEIAIGDSFFRHCCNRKNDSDLLGAETKGDEQTKGFIGKRLVDQTINFYEPFKQLSLEKFSSLKKVKVETYNKVTQFSAKSDIFGRILLIE